MTAAEGHPDATVSYVVGTENVAVVSGIVTNVV